MSWLFHALLTFFLVIVPAQRQEADPLVPPLRTAPLDEEHEKSHHEHRIGDKRELEQRPLPERRLSPPPRTAVAHQAAEGFRKIIDPRALEPRWGHSERRLC